MSLSGQKEQGYGAYLLFVIQMAGAKSIRPNDATDPAFRGGPAKLMPPGWRFWPMTAV